MMKKLFNELELQSAHWVKVNNWKQNYELRTVDGEVIATMTRPSVWRSRAEVEAAGNRWTFERKGLFRQQIEIQSVGTGESPAIFHYRMDRGRLEYHDGRVFLWQKSNMLGNRFAWSTVDGEPIVGYQVSGLLKIKGAMSLDPARTDLEVPSLLLFLGWYLITLHQDDTAAIVAAT
jgi:hypothetical protein